MKRIYSQRSEELRIKSDNFGNLTRLFKEMRRMFFFRYKVLTCREGEMKSEVPTQYRPCRFL